MREELSFGRWVQQRRRALDLTQGELAQRVACARVTIQKIESGRLRPSKQIAEQLAYHLAVPPDERLVFVQWARQRKTSQGLGTEHSAAHTAATSSTSSGLPAPLTLLIGREAELAAISKLLLSDSVRLLTLVGAPGIGKTRLALGAARQVQAGFSNGAFFIGLASINDASLVPSAIAQVLGVQETPGQPLPDTLKHFLGDKHLLLVLDNFEQIIPAAPLLTDLLAATSTLKILVTSREALHLYGEYIFEVPPLALPDLQHLPRLEDLHGYPAVELFAQRAQAVKADFALTDGNGAAIAKLCTRLDGLPLAIELAAARIRLFSPQAMLERLANRFGWLSGGPRDLPARQQTLRDTLDWSYDLLDQADQTLFGRLGVFVGGFNLKAAEGVCNPSGGLDVLGGLASLVDKSLVQQQQDMDGEPRFGMLETVREYAREKLIAAEEAAIIQNQHLDFFLHLAEEAEPNFETAEQVVWFNRMEADHDNLRAALSWSEQTPENGEYGMRLAGALWRFWGARGYHQEGRAWLLEALKKTHDVSPPVRIKALHGAVIMMTDEEVLESGPTLLKEMLDLSRQIGDIRGIAAALNLLGGIALWTGDLASARAMREEGLALWRESNDKLEIALALIYLAQVIAEEGNYAQAEVLISEAVTLYRELGNERDLGFGIYNLAEVARAQGNYERAALLYTESSGLMKKVGDKNWYSNTLLNLAATVLQLGELARAAELFRETLNLCLDAEVEHGCRWCLSGLGGVAAKLEQPERAARLLAVAEDLHFTSADQREYDEFIALTRAQLDDATFATAWTEGRVMTLEEAIAYAIVSIPDEDG